MQTIESHWNATISRPVWGNLIEDYTTANGWLTYDSLLEGGMQEAFVLNWASVWKTSGNGCLWTPQQIKNQMAEAEEWIRRGNHYLAAVQNYSGVNCTVNGNVLNFDQRSRFALAVYLLITDGSNASIYIADTRYGYERYDDLPEFRWQYGLPLGPREATGPNSFRRHFENCTVTVDLATGVADICNGAAPRGVPNGMNAYPAPLMDDQSQFGEMQAPAASTPIALPYP